MENNKKFNQIYIFFLCFFILIQAFIFVLLRNSISEKEKVIFLILIILSIVIGVSYAYVLKKSVGKVFDQINNIIDKAFSSEEVDNLDEETIVALTATKIMKYVLSRKEKLEEAVRRKEKYEKLISDISHQTKTPVSNILIYGELLLENLSKAGNENIQYASNIVSQTEKLKWLIQSLINMSRLETGIIIYNIEKNGIKELLSSILTGTYSDAEKKEINLNIREFKNSNAKFDFKWTSEALQNILGNSIKYSARKSEIDIYVDYFQYYVRITIKDYGIGIPVEEIPAVYTRFYRGKNAKKLDGVGIGLYLAKEILTAQGGYIVISKTEIVGARVMVYIPIG